MQEPLKLSYSKYIIHMNYLETMQKVILGVFLVTEVYFGDPHYIGCLKVSYKYYKLHYLSRNVDSIDCMYTVSYTHLTLPTILRV